MLVVQILAAGNNPVKPFVPWGDAHEGSRVKQGMIMFDGIEKFGPLSLSDHEVHVWYAPLDLHTPQLAQMRSVLSADECARADRFHFERHRVVFTLSHGLLRHLLAAYCGAPAAEIAFAQLPGKPVLAEPHGSTLQFNLSHTEGMAVIGLTRSCRIGIDVERLRALSDADLLVERYFAAEEIIAYRSLPSAARPRAFFRGWTRKEAFVKALGAGLGYPLHDFAVSLEPGSPQCLLAVRGDPAARDRWTLCDLEVGPQHLAALAIECPRPRLICRCLIPVAGQQSSAPLAESKENPSRGRAS